MSGLFGASSRGAGLWILSWYSKSSQRRWESCADSFTRKEPASMGTYNWRVFDLTNKARFYLEFSGNKKWWCQRESCSKSKSRGGAYPSFFLILFIQKVTSNLQKDVSRYTQWKNFHYTPKTVLPRSGSASKSQGFLVHTFGAQVKIPLLILV